MSYTKSKVPIMQVGKYAGTPVDQLPNSYLRWILVQNFPKEILECAKRKLDNSQFDNSPIHISRHALDMFSIRFIKFWIHAPENEGNSEEVGIGIATFVARLAQEAWEQGEVSTRHRYQDEGVRRDFKGIRWVYKVSPIFPDYKEVITCMAVNNKD